VKTRMTIALAAATLILTPSGAQSPVRDLYYGVTIIDPATETVQPDSYIAVEAGQIVEVGRGQPPAAPNVRLHDYRGHFAMPGLIDTHAHVTLGPMRIETEDGPKMVAAHRPDVVTHNARHLLAFGVTTIRNPGGDMAANQAYDTRIAAGLLDGPEAFHAGEVIDRSPIPIEGLVSRPGPDLSVSDIVRRQSTAGADFIKLYTNLSEEELKQGIDTAHAANRKTIAHLSDVSWTRAAEIGIDSIVHMMPISPDLLPEDRRMKYRKERREGFFQSFEWYEAADFDAEPVREMIETLAREKVFIDATLVAFQPAFWGDRPEIRDRDLAFVHPDMAANWQAGFRFDLGWKEQDYRRAQAVWPKVLSLTRWLHEAGVPMTIGTDLANPFIAPGISLSREMELHLEAGIPAWAVLRMATVDGARLLGIEGRTGRIKPGHEADILILKADPLADFANLRQVRAVLNNGKLLCPAELRQARAEPQ